MVFRKRDSLDFSFTELEFLYLLTTQNHSLSSIGDIIGIRPVNVWKVSKKLEQAGLINIERFGKGKKVIVSLGNVNKDAIKQCFELLQKLSVMKKIIMEV